MTNLEQYREIALNAYRNTSFNPEKRANRDLIEIKSHLSSVQEEINESQLTDEKKENLYSWYKTKLINLQLKYWCAESRCVNWAITGRSGLNVNRVNKTRDIADNRTREFLEFWNYDISKLIAKNLPDEIKSNLADRADIIALDEYIQNCLCNAHCFTKQLLQGKIERLINNRKLATAEYAINKCREHKIFTERNKIFKLFDELKAKLSAPQEKTPNQEYQINDIRVLENTEIDRLQIFFKGKPDGETINKLKSSGWHWSPRFKAWQRQLTQNAKNSLNLVLKGF